MLNRSVSKSQAGFSLVEMIVAVALFAVVMVIAIGAMLSLVDANRKARSLESVMNNLNISLDSMVRSLRQGTDFACDSEAIPNPTTGEDCTNGGSVVSFAPFGSNPGNQSERWAYAFQDGQLFKSENGGALYVPITAPEVTIEDMRFYVVGTARGDTIQPKVVMVVKGRAGANERTRTTFYIQATAVQRVLDI